MRLISLAITLAVLLPVLAAADPGPAERLELIQRPDIVVQHQRLVGNVRAQARREGVVVNLPQLYVYLSDHTASWHHDGYREGFERELNLMVTRQRRGRSMVRLDRLLERIITPAGEEITIADLPAGDVYLLLYRRKNCADCDRVESAMIEWLEATPEISAVWIDIYLDRRPGN